MKLRYLWAMLFILLAQSGIALDLARIQQFFDDPPASGGGGFPFTIAGHTNVSVVGTGPVTFDLNTTGIGLLVISESFVQMNGSTDADPHDGVNTYVPLNSFGYSAGLATNQMFYVVNPTGGNITISATHDTTTLCAEWYSVVGTASLDQQAPGGSDDNTHASVSPGTIVNSADRLFITGVSAIVGAGLNSPPIDSSFIATSSTNVAGSGGFSAGMAHKQSSTDETPNWGFAAVAFAGSTMATFTVGNCTPAFVNDATDRTPTVNVTASSALFNNANGATNLVGGAFTGRFWFNGATLDGSQFITVDFTNATLVTEFIWYMDTASAQGTWQWSGSLDDVSYTPIGATYTLGGAAAVGGVSTNFITTVSGNTVKYRYYKNTGVSGSINSSPYQLNIGYKYCQ